MRLGLLGGTFDPPHIGHLIAAQDALEALTLDRVAFLPAALPPHKLAQPISAPSHRLAMLRAAIGDDTRFGIESIELERSGPSYTVDTLRALSARGDMLFLLIGTDQWAEFHTWREPAEIARLAQLGILRRAGDAADTVRAAEGTSPASVHDIPVTRVDVSSTLIRQAVAQGRSIRYLVAPAVADYIAEHGLYRSAPDNDVRGAATRARTTSVL